MKLLVTGATGDFGGKVVNYLLKKIPANELAVSVRNPEKASYLQKLGVDVRKGNFDYPETLETAFADVDRLLIVSADGDNETRIKQHTNAINAAKRAKVQFIVYTSLINATNSTNLFAPTHTATESAIKESGIPYAFLRNNWYLENETSNIQGILSGAPWFTSAKDAKVGWALKEDYAEAAAIVLTTEGHENKTYELTGLPISQEVLVEKLEKILEKNISIQYVDDKSYSDIMKEAGVPEYVLPILVDIQRSIRDGSLDFYSDDLENLLGRPVTPLEIGLSKIIENLKIN